jgi:hypothetical protein
LIVSFKTDKFYTKLRKKIKEKKLFEPSSNKTNKKPLAVKKTKNPLIISFKLTNKKPLI